MRVASVEFAGFEDVYNMEVEDTHDFIIQGGVVAHNCADESRYFFMSRPIAPATKRASAPITEDPLNQRVVKKKARFS